MLFYPTTCVLFSPLLPTFSWIPCWKHTDVIKTIVGLLYDAICHVFFSWRDLYYYLSIKFNIASLIHTESSRPCFLPKYLCFVNGLKLQNRVHELLNWCYRHVLKVILWYNLKLAYLLGFVSPNITWGMFNIRYMYVCTFDSIHGIIWALTTLES